MLQEQYTPLWNKIKDFELDDGTAAITFSDKLAAEQQWTNSYTQRAITEYKKFILLCCILPNGAAPSNPVDEVWHLHLTYTLSYWDRFCKDILGKDIHHYPSSGGPEEDEKHRQWYADTLQQYRKIFDAEPPADIWPAPGTAATDTPDTILLEKPTLAHRFIGALIALLIALPFLFIWWSLGTPDPFALGGPHFVTFFLTYGAVLCTGYVIRRFQLRKSVETITDTHFPSDATPFQVAAFLYGRHRALQAGIVDLIKRGLLEVDAKKRFTLRKDRYEPIDSESNPLIPPFLETRDNRTYHYKEIMKQWYDPWKFSHPALEALKSFTHRREPFFQSYFFLSAFLIIGIPRIIQGLYNGKPIYFLVLEIIVFALLFLLIMKSWSLLTIVRDRISDLYESGILTSARDPVVTEYALRGAPAISGFAEGILLGSIFSAAAPFDMQGQSSWGSGNNCSSGGGGGGGGGCGGCSGV